MATGFNMRVLTNAWFRDALNRGYATLHEWDNDLGTDHDRAAGIFGQQLDNRAPIINSWVHCTNYRYDIMMAHLVMRDRSGAAWFWTGPRLLGYGDGIALDVRTLHFRSTGS